ncbi:MAG TPA: response regulator [Longimicrobiales bacterium]|nr:response regulator [Longimicrobiales bacterium]
MQQRSEGRGLEGSWPEGILVVDDEDAVRRWVARVLTRGGYHVLEAGNGSAALDVLKAHAPRVDLVLTDVFMPGRGGRDLAMAVRGIYPQLRLVFMSGVTEDFGEGGGFGEGAVFLEKPFTEEELLRVVRDELAGG